MKHETSASKCFLSNEKRYLCRDLISSKPKKKTKKKLSGSKEREKKLTEGNVCGCVNLYQKFIVDFNECWTRNILNVQVKEPFVASLVRSLHTNSQRHVIFKVEKKEIPWFLMLWIRKYIYIYIHRIHPSGWSATGGKVD